MKISSIKQQVRNPERASLYLEGKYSFSLSLDQLLQEGLKVGLEIDATRLERLKVRSAEGKLRARALHWLLLRSRSTKELRDYLARKKASPEFVDLLLDHFKKRGYLNDAAFAKQWIEHRRASKHRSNHLLKMELLQKGIDRETVDELLQDSAEPETTALKALIEKKKRQPRYANDPQKLIQYLLRQGYSYSLVKQVLLSDE